MRMEVNAGCKQIQCILRAFTACINVISGVNAANDALIQRPPTQFSMNFSPAGVLLIAFTCHFRFPRANCNTRLYGKIENLQDWGSLKTGLEAPALIWIYLWKDRQKLHNAADYLLVITYLWLLMYITFKQHGESCSGVWEKGIKMCCEYFPLQKRQRISYKWYMLNSVP